MTPKKKKATEACWEKHIHLNNNGNYGLNKKWNGSVQSMSMTQRNSSRLFVFTAQRESCPFKQQLAKMALNNTSLRT